MGLDMYLEGHVQLTGNRRDPSKDDRRDGYRVKGVVIDLGYWRKHPDLHGYIVQAFADGVDECQPIELNAQSIRNIISAIRAKRLPHTEGFFFGQSDGSEDAETINTFENALAWLEGVERVPMMKHTEPTPIGGGLVMMEVNPAAVEVNEWRSVIYRASW